MQKKIIAMLTIVLLFGCNIDNHPKQISPLQVNDPALVDNQTVASQAKDIVLKMKEVKKVQAVDLNRDVIVAVELKHQYKLRSKKHIKRIKEKLDQEFPEKIIKVTPDHKIFIELEQLEQHIEERKIDKNQLKKELDHLKHLLNEQI